LRALAALGRFCWRADHCPWGAPRVRSEGLRWLVPPNCRPTDVSGEAAVEILRLARPVRRWLRPLAALAGSK
jgi:hypothetical protein